MDRRDTRLSAEDLVLEGAGLRVSVPLIAQGNSYPSENVQTYTFRYCGSSCGLAWAAFGLQALEETEIIRFKLIWVMLQ